MIIENEKAEADRLVKATRIKNEELTKKYEQLIIDNDHRMHVEDHVREISEMKRVTGLIYCVYYYNDYFLIHKYVYR